MQENPFEPDITYKVKTAFQCGPSSFEAGEHLKFSEQSFSPYDNAYVYAFRPTSGGEDKAWFVQSGTVPDWERFFERLD